MLQCNLNVNPLNPQLNCWCNATLALTHHWPMSVLHFLIPHFCYLMLDVQRGKLSKRRYNCLPHNNLTLQKNINNSNFNLNVFYSVLLFSDLSYWPSHHITSYHIISYHIISTQLNSIQLNSTQFNSEKWNNSKMKQQQNEQTNILSVEKVKQLISHVKNWIFSILN